MPSVVKKKLISTSTTIGRKSGIALSGSQVSLTPRPVTMSTPRAASPVKISAPATEKMQIKKLRPKSAVPTINRTIKLQNKVQTARPLSANALTRVVAAKADSNASSPTLAASDEISLWMSDEMLRTENKSLESSASTSCKIISPFSENSGSDSEKTVAKQLRFADEQSDDFIDSVVEQLKDQVKFDISSGNIKIQRRAKGTSKSRRPKSIEELLDIIDSEIPIALRSSAKTVTRQISPQESKSVNKKESRERTALQENLEIVEDKLDDGYVSKMSEQAGPEEDDLSKEEDTVPPLPKVSIEKIPNLSDDSLRNIFNFLDKMEENDLQMKAKPLYTSKISDMATKTQGNNQIQILKDALEEKSAHVQLLKEAMLQTKVENADALSAVDKEHRIMSRKQKLEYESALKKLQDGMEKLISDKKSLVEKVEELVQKLREAESKHLSAIQALQQRQTIEIARTKQIAAATEKVRREKWVERQTARIKELTVKGLEPELTRLNLQHESKIAQLQAGHSKELQAQVEAESRRVEELRTLMLKEKDDELARERTLISERYERQLAEERAMTELRCERLREEATAESARQQAAWNAQKEAMVAQAWQETLRVQSVHDQQILLLDEKKQAEIAAAREELREEQSNWLTVQNRKNTELLSVRQQELKEQRDKEIEKAIEQLEAEERRNRLEHDKEVAKKLNRLKEQHKAVLTDRDLNEKLLFARLTEAQKAMEESEKQMLAAKSNESRLKQGLCISEQRVQALDGEHSRIKEIVEKQYREKIAQLEIKMQQMKEEREAELCQVHARLKGVLEKKEQCIEHLKSQEAELIKRCKHLESLLGR